jgi:predicted nucleotide-binding protein
MPPRRQAGRQGTEKEPMLRVATSQLDGEIEKRLELGQELLDRRVEVGPGSVAADVQTVRDFNREFSTWDEFNERLLRSRFTTPKAADEYKRVTIGIGELPPQQELYWAREGIREQMRRLSSVRDQLPLYESEVAEDSGSKPTTGAAMGSKIFLVHGHDGARKLEVAQFLQEGTGERPIILHEPASKGRTIIEKFEDHASEAGFAVILLTADDVGRAKKDTDLKSRARQNVVFEFGFFVGALGRANVVALVEEVVERPSDTDGVLYIPLAGNWKTELAKEIRAARIKLEL